MLWGGRSICNKCKKERYNMKKVIIIVISFGLISCSNIGQKKLKIAVVDGLFSLDPHTQDEQITSEILGNVYESLVTFDIDMNPIPLLATGYVSINDVTWRFYLRPNVVFHNKNKISSKDVIYSLERARSHSTSVYRSLLAAIEKYETIDSLTVDIITVNPQPNLINTLALISIIPFNADPAKEPVGTGPYSVITYQPNSKLGLKYFPGYWQGEVDYKDVEFQVIDNDSLRLMSLLTGRVDIDANVMENYREKISSSPGFTLITTVGTSITALGIKVSGKTKGNPLSDIRLRKAISLAIDRQKMIDQACCGQAVPARQMLTKSIFGYNPDMPPLIQDLPMAKRLVKSLGAKDSIRLTIKVSPPAALEGQLIAEDLRQAGIELKVDILPWSKLYDQITNGQADFFLMGFGYTFGDASELLNDMIHSQGISNKYGSRNLFGYCNPKLDEKIEQADKEFNPTKRQVLLQEAVKIMTEDLPFIPLYIKDNNYGFRQGIRWRPKTGGAMYLKEIHPAI